MADGLLNKASIILTPTGYKAGTLYNVAPIDEPYEDFDFARASVASRVNSSGLVEMVGRTLSSELVTNGDFATDSDWTLGGAATIENDALHLESATNEYSYARQDISSLAAKTYKIQLEIKNYVSGACQVGFTGTSPIFKNLNVTADGTYTAYVSPNTNGDDLEISREYSGGNFNFDVDNVSVKEIIDTNNIPRISYDSNGDNGHILLEPTSTNLIPYSEDFSLWSLYNYGGASLNLTSGYLAPDGSANGYEFDFTQSSGGSLITLNTTATASADHSLSIWLKGKVGGEKVKIDFKNTGSSGVSGELFTLTTDWVRYDVTVTNDTGTSRGFQIRLTNSDSIGTETFYAWGAQLEELPYATSYIPTLTGSTVTRATETATGAGSADLINSTEGVLYAEIAGLVDADTYDRIISLSDNTTTNRVEMQLSSSGSIKGRFDSASSDITLTETGLTASNFNKIALVWSSGRCALYLNGVKEQEDLTFSTFASDVLFDLSFKSPYNDADGSRDFYGKCKALAVFNEALSDDELNNLTG